MSWLKSRKKGFKPVKDPILIVCEDSKSSVYYLKEKVKSCGLSPDNVIVDGDSDSSPPSVVSYALQKRKEQKKQAKKEGIYEYEAVYCVMDVDDHPNLRDAIYRALDNGLIPIISNECFELWYLLHFVKYSTAHINRNELKRKLSSYLGINYDKSDDSIFDRIKDNEHQAIDLARRLDISAQDESDERNPKRNPSTEVYILIEKINSKRL